MAAGLSHPPVREGEGRAGSRGDEQPAAAVSVLRRAGRDALAALGLAVATAVQALPSPSDLGSRFATNVGDPVFLMWQLTTQSHALVRNPTTLMQGNIFYPHQDAMAYSDSLLAYLPVYGPALRLSGDNPILAYNVLLFVGYLGGALAVYALARMLLGARLPAFGAALLFTMSPYRSAALAHLQLAGFLFIPLALLLLVRFIERRRWSDAVLFGVMAGATWLASLYCAMMLLVAVPGFLVVWLAMRRFHPGERFWRGMGLAMVTAVVLMAPTLPAYVRVLRSGVITRAARELIPARISAFTNPPPSLVYRAVGIQTKPPDIDSLYPGAVLLALALLGVAALWLAWRGRGAPATVAGSGVYSERRATFALPLAAAAVAGTLVMVGPDHGPLLSEPYRVLHSFLPGMSSIRDLTRFWLLPLMLLALLAGRGILDLLRRLPGRTGQVVVLVVLAVALLELGYRQDYVSVATSGPFTDANQELTRLPAGPVMELPLPVSGFEYAFVTATNQLRSTIDGLPRVEGYSGATPPDVKNVIYLATAFPAPVAIAALRADGVRYVVLHAGGPACWARFSQDEMAAMRTALASAAGVSRLIPAGNDLIVELAPAPIDRASIPSTGEPPDRPVPPCAEW